MKLVMFFVNRHEVEDCRTGSCRRRAPARLPTCCRSCADGEGATGSLTLAPTLAILLHMETNRVNFQNRGGIHDRSSYPTDTLYQDCGCELTESSLARVSVSMCVPCSS